MLAVPASLVLLLVQPRAANPDAVAHAVRIDEVGRGRIVTQLDSDRQAVVRLDGCLAAMTADMQTQQMAGFSARFADLFRSAPCGRPRSVNIGNSAINTPVTYLFALPGWWLGRGFGADRALAAATVSQLVLYLAVVWFAIRMAPRGKPLLFALAMLPVSLRGATTLSSDAVPLALTVLAVALLLRLWEQTPDRSEGAAGDAGSTTRSGSPRRSVCSARAIR